VDTHSLAVPATPRQPNQWQEQVWAATYRRGRKPRPAPQASGLNSPIAHHSFHRPSCPVLPPHPLRAKTSIPSSTLLSKPTRRKQGRTLPHILWPHSFNPVIPPMPYLPFSEDKSPPPINPRVAMKDSQNISLQPSTSYTRFPPHLAKESV
jgi:hypothetical protein